MAVCGSALDLDDHSFVSPFVQQRDAVWLRWMEGAGYARVAEALDCSRESARANVYQGLKKLREELFDLWEEEFPG